MSDTLELFYNDPNGTKIQIPLTTTGIAWWTDKHVKFRNPGVNNPNLTAVFQGISSSFFWGHQTCCLICVLASEPLASFFSVSKP